ADGVSARWRPSSGIQEDSGTGSGLGPSAAVAAPLAVGPEWGCHACPGAIRMGGNRMLKGKGHVLAVIVAVAAGGWFAAGCSAHVSIGETPAVSRHDVETEVATTLARQENQPVPKVVCPGDLKGKVGAVMYCSLTAQGSDTT